MRLIWKNEDELFSHVALYELDLDEEWGGLHYLVLSRCDGKTEARVFKNREDAAAEIKGLICGCASTSMDKTWASQWVDDQLKTFTGDTGAGYCRTLGKYPQSEL